MARADKAAAVAELAESFRTATATVLTEYRGLTVGQLKELRRSLADNARYAVVKNTLTKLAVREAGVTELEPLLEGPSAVAFVTGDPVVVAKSIRDFAKAHPALIVKGGMLDGRPLTPDELRKLADLESREVLLAKLAGAMKASLSQAVYVLNAPLAQAARLFGALQAQLPAEAAPVPDEAPAAAEAPAADEAPAAETPGPAEMASDGTPGTEETPDTTAADAAGDPGAAAQAVADATDVPPDTDVADGATSTS